MYREIVTTAYSSSSKTIRMTIRESRSGVSVSGEGMTYSELIDRLRKKLKEDVKESTIEENE